jgi:membrane protein
LKPLRFIGRVVRRMRAIGLARAASSLSFTTLLALVPMLTVLLAFVAEFPVFRNFASALEGFVLRNLLPGSTATVAHEYILKFAAQAARLTGVSIAAIAVTAALALATIEREFNLIWDVRKSRPLARRVVVYLLGLTAFPVLLGASISLTTWLVGESLAVVSIRKTSSEVVLRTLPFLFAVAGLALLYKMVPARPVRWSQALAGGVAAALAIEAAKYGFVWYVAQVATYELVYGALAALPVFLVWIYLGWVVVLAGAAICATLGENIGTSA